MYWQKVKKQVLVLATSTSAIVVGTDEDFVVLKSKL